MLRIKVNDRFFGQTEWHVGEPFPAGWITRVMTFQADGDELRVILDAIKEASSKK